jgi:hypothetical protein
MSKFLLNLPVQISKALVYTKIKFYSEKNFSVAFGPAAAHLLLFSTDIFPPSHWASASQPAHLALLAQSTTRRWRPAGLPPSPRPADRWAPPIIPHLRLHPSSAAPPPSPFTPRAAQLHPSDAARAITRPPSLPPP